MNDLRQAIDRFPLAEWTAETLPIVVNGTKNIMFDCPFCMSRKKLYIGKLKKVARCFHCEGVGHHQWSGRAGAVEWVSLLKPCSKGEAVKIILQHVGMPLAMAVDVSVEDYSLPRESMLISKACDSHHPCRIELRRRGLEHLSDYWRVCVTGKYARRVIMPVEFFGHYFGFEAKTYCGGEPKSLSHYASGALYSTRCWDKSRTLATIVEGIYDAETIGVNTIALLGSSLSAERMETLLKVRDMGVDTLVFFLDDDAIDKQKRLIYTWTSIYFKTKFVKCPLGQDPNSLGLTQSWNLIHSATEIDNIYDLVMI